MLLWALVVAGLGLVALPVGAQIRATYQFSLNDANGTPVTGTPSFAPGASFTWRVYLVDNGTMTQANAPAGVTVGGASAPFLDASSTNSRNQTFSGLGGSGVNVSSSNPNALAVQSNPPPPVTNTGDSSVTPTAASTVWQSWTNNGSTANNIHLTVSNFSGSVTTSSTGNSPGRILLGTYDFRVPAGATGGAVTLTASDPNPQPGDTAYAGNGNINLDASIGNGTQALTVTAVPEPGSMLLCGLGAVGLAAYRRRNKKTAAVETAA